MKKHPPVPSRDYATLVERVRSLRAHGRNVRETGEVCECYCWLPSCHPAATIHRCYWWEAFMTPQRQR